MLRLIKILSGLLLINCLSWSFGGYVYSNERMYSIARAPQQSPRHLAKNWLPFVDFLSSKLGIKFALVLYQSRTEFEHSLLAGKPDLLFSSPFYFMVAHKSHRYRALVRSKTRKLQGLLVVRHDSQIDNLRQLEGATLAFPSPNAFASSLMIRSHLQETLGISINAVYSDTHANVYRYVLLNKAQAGGGVSGTLRQERVALQDKLTILYMTPNFVAHPLSANPRVPEHISKQIIAAIFELANTEDGQKMLAQIQLEQPITTTYKNDYSFLQTLNLEKFSTLPNHH